MNGYADDLAAVIEHLDLKDVTAVGQSADSQGRAEPVARLD